MMRKPTPLAEQLAWWRNAVETGDRTVIGDQPQCGWFKAREKARSKTWLPARIWLEQPMDWETGELTAPERFVLQIAEEVWTRELEVAERWLFLRPVSQEEWRWLTARLALHKSLNGMRVPTYTFG
jgi:hypothetical protein